MFNRLIVVAVAALGACAASPGGVPLQSRERVQSTHGFSFLPPQETNWRERFGRNEITYLKETDPRVVSFIAGAIEGELRSALPDNEALIAWVRSKKDDWGNDGRYSNTATTFDIEANQESCVRYQLSANDHNATNKGSLEFLILRTVGRFCVHPQDRTVAVDLYYSVRHVPLFDTKGLIAEGEEFLRGLQFTKKPG